MKHLLLLVSLFLLLKSSIRSQDDSAIVLSKRSVDNLSDHCARLDRRMTRGMSVVIERFERTRRHLLKRLPTAEQKSTQLLVNEQEAQQRTELTGGLPGNMISAGIYLPSLDTLQTLMRFIVHKGLVTTPSSGSDALGTLNRLNSLEEKFIRSTRVKDLLKQATEQLRIQINNSGLTRQWKQLSKQVYFYAEQLNEYKSMMIGVKNAAQRLIRLLCERDVVREFLRSNSLLASFFPITAHSEIASGVGRFGLQTKAQVYAIIGSMNMASGQQPPLISANLQHAFSAFASLKEQAYRLGRENMADVSLLELRPNEEHEKAFNDRICFAFNSHVQRATAFFPVTTEIGIDVGYKTNKRASMSLGAGGKLGWGTEWHKQKFTNEGFEVRIGLDWKIKEMFWLTVQYARDYCTSLKNIVAISPLSIWQPRGLAGISKLAGKRSRWLRQAKLQVLWDLLSYWQKPKGEAFSMRMTYPITRSAK